MLSGKSTQKLAEWWRTGKQHFAELLSSSAQGDTHNLIGLVINAQYLKLLKIKHVGNQYEVEYFEIIDLPEGLIVDTEIKNPTAVANILKNIFTDISTKNVVISIPRSSAIVKTINVDHRLQADEIESRVWLEANRLFPNLIGDIYLDFAVNGPSIHDATQNEILVVACRKDQINPYLDVMKLADLNTKVIDINYYAYERALSLITKQSPEIKTTALLNISFKLIDLLVISEGKLIYTHESSFDGTNLLKLLKKNGVSIPEPQPNMQLPVPNGQVNEILKNTIGVHLKHAMQFFYSSRPNVRLDRIILSGDAAAVISGMQEYVQQEVGKEVVMGDPFGGMNFAPNVDQARLTNYAPGLMLCCGLALTGNV